MAIFLTSTNDLISLITETAVTIDVFACYNDLNTSTNKITPGRTSTNITTATTTTIVSSPSSNIIRDVTFIHIKNKHITSNCIITLKHTDGSTAVELDKRTLEAGDELIINKNGDITPLPLSGRDAPSYYGIVAAAYGDGNPNTLFEMIQTNGIVSPTQANITTSIARCCLFRLPFDLTVRKIRMILSVAGQSDNFRVAIYRYSDKKRLTDSLIVSNQYGLTSNEFGFAGSENLELELYKDILYFIAVTVIAYSADAYVVAFGPTVAATTGQIQAAPQSLPGSLDVDSGYIDSYNFQFAVTDGVLPDPAATLAAQAAWTGGMPAFWLDSSLD